jgi:hypothetical protein
MFNKFNSGLSFTSFLIGNSIYLSLIAVLIYLNPEPIRGQDYWINAPKNGSKIFTVSFFNGQNGKAVSTEGDVFITTDCGKNWKIQNKFSDPVNNNQSSFLWKAEIYCSVMQTTDSGTTWIPYDKYKQEHFCGVYLKDQNMGYEVASEFLNKVTTFIINNYNKDEISLLINHPQKCTEYYRDASEGWALGWCLKSFNQNSITQKK